MDCIALMFLSSVTGPDVHRRVASHSLSQRAAVSGGRMSRTQKFGRAPVPPRLLGGTVSSVDDTLLVLWEEISGTAIDLGTVALWREQRVRKRECIFAVMKVIAPLLDQDRRDRMKRAAPTEQPVMIFEHDDRGLSHPIHI